MEKTVISNEDISLTAYVKSIIKFRSLILSYVRKDIKVKYAQTFLGVIWSFFQPLVALCIFVLFFDKLIHIENNQLSYPVFAFSGIVLWQYFVYVVSSSSTSLIANQDIIKKVYFPKIILPLSKTISGLFEFGISLLLLFVLMVILGQPFSIKLLFIPVVILLLIIVGLTVSLWLSALTVKMRDLQHAVPYLIHFGIWLSPVFYPVTIIPQPYTNWMYYLNPLAVILKTFRWILMNESAPQPTYFLSFVWVFILLIAGIFYFKKIEKQIADFI